MKRLPNDQREQRTQRLHLRPPIEADLDAWASWLADVETVRFLSGATSTPSLISIVRVDNHASHAVAASLGMRDAREATISDKPGRIWQIDLDTWRATR